MRKIRGNADDITRTDGLLLPAGDSGPADFAGTRGPRIYHRSADQQLTFAGLNKHHIMPSLMDFYFTISLAVHGFHPVVAEVGEFFIGVLLLIDFGRSEERRVG